MLPSDALQILALAPGATPAEVKEAYRDMVKVWHPDRFGSDPRLRQKAEAKLKEINEAYRLLQMNPEAGQEITEDRYRAARENPVRSAPRPVSSSEGASDRKEDSSRRNVTGVGWVYAGSVIAVVSLIVWFVLQYGPMRRAAALSRVPHETTAEVPGADVSGNNAPSSSMIDRKPTPKEAGQRNDAGAVGFSVRPLSDVETSRLEAACSGLKETKGDAIYRECIKAQLNLMTKARSRPDLSGLNQAERESVESMCSGIGRGHGTAGYYRCLTAGMAEAMAEPVRPDLATLNNSDRSAVEVACRNAKYREGPAAYDRCLVRTIRLLEQTR